MLKFLYTNMKTIVKKVLFFFFFFGGGGDSSFCENAIYATLIIFFQTTYV